MIPSLAIADRLSPALPAGLQDIIGHARVLEQLRRAIAADRLSHAYLVTGPEGVGRATLALAIAAALNCEALPDERPCGACRSCRLIRRGAYGDVRTITRDPERRGILLRPQRESSTQDTEHSVDFIQTDAQRRPVYGRKKVYLLLGADDLMQEAANRLLKTLEEPTAYVHFVLTAADRQSVLPTIASRCQEVRLEHVPRTTIETALVERGLADAQRAAELARWAEGRPGWALAAARDPARVEVFRANVRELQQILASPRLERLALGRGHADRWTRDKEAVRGMLRAWLSWLRHVLLLQIGVGDGEASADEQRYADALSTADVARGLERVAQSLSDLESNVNHRLVLDTLLLSLPSVQG